MRVQTLFAVSVATLGLTPVLPPQQTDVLREANRAASILVLERLKTRDPAAWNRIRRAPASAILLVDGRHDHSNQVLSPLGLRYSRVTGAAFARRSLRGVELLIIDCPGSVDLAGTRKAAEFVRRGGTLLTTDWAVRHVLRSGFGGKIRHNGVRTRDDVVRVDSVTPHRLTRHVFPRGRTAAWWLEDQSYPVVSESSDVVVLFRSRQLQDRYDSGIVACTFPLGRGRVVHVVSHIYLQRTIHTHPWERRSALDEASALDLPKRSAGYRKLARSGVLGRVRAGDLNATLSVQQFLLNIVDYALGRRPPHPIHPPRPVPRPAPHPPRSEILTHVSTSETHLSRTPGGAEFLKVNKGLRLSVVRRESNWVLVRTPIGREGWIRETFIARRRPGHP